MFWDVLLFDPEYNYLSSAGFKQWWVFVFLNVCIIHKVYDGRNSNSDGMKYISLKKIRLNRFLIFYIPNDDSINSLILSLFCQNKTTNLTLGPQPNIWATQLFSLFEKPNTPVKGLLGAAAADTIPLLGVSHFTFSLEFLKCTTQQTWQRFSCGHL